MIVVFAGAGASYALEPDKFPTTQKFFENLPNNISDNFVFKNIVEYLNKVNGKEIVDIEHVLWEIGDFKAALNGIIDVRRPAGWMFESNKMSSGCKATQKDIKPWAEAAENLESNIQQLVYDYYEHQTENKLWETLLEGLVVHKTPINVFTTNYDNILDDAVSSNQNLKFIQTGRHDRKTRRLLDFSKWMEQKNGSFLTKLHGSIDWAYINGELRVSASGYMGSHKKHMILYPGFKGVPDREPFITFHKHLENVLSSASVLIIIGFAFRDEHINMILNKYTNKNTLICIVDKHKLPSAMPFEGKAVKAYLDGFDDKAVMKLLSDISLSGKFPLTLQSGVQALTELGNSILDNAAKAHAKNTSLGNTRNEKKAQNK